MLVELLHITPDAEKVIESAGRTAWLSFDKQNENSADSFVKMLIKRKHYSVLEHATATFRISGVSRTMTHQIVRHRHGSYTQQSQRVVDEAQLKAFTIPPSIMKDGWACQFFIGLINMCFDCYDYLIKAGINKEDARFILPNACQTQLVMSGNFRTWRHIIRVRGSKFAQWELRTVIREIHKILVNKCPSAFEDLKVYEEDL